MSMQSGPQGYYFSHAQLRLSMKFKLIINTEIAEINGNFRFRKPKVFTQCGSVIIRAAS